MSNLRLGSKYLDTRPPHNTQGSRIKIFYPFHPLCSSELELSRKSPDKSGMILVKAPDGFCKQIPVWMTEPNAIYFRISATATISCRALVKLAEVLKKNTSLQEKGIVSPLKPS